MHSLYIVHEREFINSKQNIYKIGRSEQACLRRIKTYPKGSELYFHMRVSDSVRAEKRALRAFKSMFKQRKDIGKEYFEGDIRLMLSFMFQIAMLEFSETRGDVTVNETRGGEWYGRCTGSGV